MRESSLQKRRDGQKENDRKRLENAVNRKVNVRRSRRKGRDKGRNTNVVNYGE